MLWFFIRTRIYILYKLAIRKLMFVFAELKDAPIIIAIGDSWFNLTMGKWQSVFTVSILDWLKKQYKYNIFNMAIPGYTFSDELKYKLFKYPLQRIVKKQQHELVILLSMGGNDVLFADVKNMIIKKDKKYIIDDKEVRKFVKKFTSGLSTYVKMIKKFFKSKGGKKLSIIIHGYGYVNLKHGQKNRNLSTVFNKYKIPIEVANKSLKIFIDVLNQELKILSTKDPTIEYIDLRKLVGVTEFLDDIHPTREAFKKIAIKYDKILSKHIKK